MAIEWRLRELMARKQVSNKLLAKKCGVHNITISRWRAYNTMPPITGEKLEKIAEVLEVSVSELLNLPEEKEC